MKADQRFIPLILCAAGLLLYANSLGGPFIFDDEVAITGNPFIRHLWPPWNAMRAVDESPLAGRPIVSLTFAINHALGGFNVWGYHVFNVVLHILNALLLFGIVKRTLETEKLRSSFAGESAWLAGVSAMLWLVHPLNTEAVNYVTQRTELMVALFLLTTLYCVIRGSTEVSISRRTTWCVAALLACGLGMGCKEVMVAAPLLVFLYDRSFLTGSFRESWRQRKWLYAGLGATWLIVAALIATGPRSATVGLTLDQLTPWDYAKTQCGVILHYLRLSFWPHPLALDHDDWPVARSLASILPQGIGLLLLLGSAAWALRVRPAIGFLGAWFFVILAPSSSFVPIASEVVAERRMYLPLMAVVVLVVIGARNILKGSAPQFGLATAILLAAVLATMTFDRNAAYRSEVSIWSDTVAKRPNNARAHGNLAIAFGKMGHTPEAVSHFRRVVELTPHNNSARLGLAAQLTKAGQTNDAIRQYDAVLRIEPSHAEAHCSLGFLLAAQGRFDVAMAHYAEALRIQPDFALAHHNWAIALEAQGNLAEAAGHYREAMRAQPGFAEPSYNLGILFLRQGKLAEAIESFTQALRARPDYVEARINLGLALASQQRFPQAMEQYNEAIRHRPHDAGLRNNLGVALGSLGQHAQAEQQFREAIRLRPEWADAYFNLALALADQGNLGGAVASAEKALKLAQTQGQQPLVREIRQRIELFRARAG